MVLTAQDEVERIRKKLGHLSMKAMPPAYLDTGFPDLNEVLGCRDYGIPYGRIIEISGWESHGKTAIGLSILALAQQHGAAALKGDFESSHDANWDTRRGVDVSKLQLFQPYVGTFGSKNKKTLRLCTAEELCSEIEAALAYNHGHGYEHQVLLVDSVPAIMPEGVAMAGLEGRNMRVRLELSMFLSALLQRWVGLAQAYSTLIIFINQLRQKPGKVFGDPAYTPGGNALRFYSHIRARVKRVPGGIIKHAGKTIGMKGIITCKKNKVGGTEGARVGYRLLFKGPIEFLSALRLEKEAKEAKGDGGE